MTWYGIVASVGMAIGPSLVYADQVSVFARKMLHSTGFSRDVCAILLIANIARCFFWIGNRFEIALLVQSVLLIATHLGMLWICLTFRPAGRHDSYGLSTRPFGFWQWQSYSTYIQFLLSYILVLGILTLILGRSEWFVGVLGFFALGLESTLPVPQLISNYRQKSLYGFRMSTLLGWFGGDAFKTFYFFWNNSPLQFTVCAIFQLSIDVGKQCPSVFNLPAHILPNSNCRTTILVRHSCASCIGRRGRS
ncbi:hypothetical protein BKA62DRAFT_612389 [Auriculariales sp. MPI-PUGE-AT-0066]|nr:hypothetical protein BKA62DRAFT_612389 [Auriculariales sp. MPI-PUGE-AT-0066]